MKSGYLGVDVLIIAPLCRLTGVVPELDMWPPRDDATTQKKVTGTIT